MKRIFLYNPAPGEGGGGGGGAATPPAATPSAAPAQGAMDVFNTPSEPQAPAPSSPPTPPVQGGTPPSAPAATTPAAPTAPQNVIQLSPEQLQDMVRAAGANVQQPPAAPQTPQQAPTQEEFDRMFHVVRPNQQQLEAVLGGGPQAIEALTQLLHGAARQATVMAAYQMQEIENRLRTEINPVQSYYREQQEKALYDEFLTTNKHLKEFEPVIKQVVTSLKAQKVNFPNKEAAFKRVADDTVAFIRSLPGLATWQPGGAAPAAAAPTPGAAPSSQTPSGMSTLSGGGQGGAGGQPSGGASKSKSAGMQVFD
jgi:hypothetical protein